MFQEHKQQISMRDKKVYELSTVYGFLYTMDEHFDFYKN